MNPLDKQVGGNHYRRLNPQPIELISELKLTFIQGNVVKYLLRAPYKGRELEDLKKAYQYFEFGELFEENQTGISLVPFQNFLSANKDFLSREYVSLLTVYFLYLSSHPERHREVKKIFRYSFQKAMHTAIFKLEANR